MIRLARLGSASLLVVLFVAGCGGRVSTPTQPLASVSIGDSTARTVSSASPVGPGDGRELLSEPLDLVAEEDAANGCVEAWRKALKGDEPGAMEQLRALDKKYPRLITIRLMMGQVEERSGKKKEAVQFYRDAVEKSQFNAMYRFKLAEALRTTGDATAAIPHYRKLLDSAPEFVPVRLGLARALHDVDANSSEARQQAQRALDLDPASAEAKKLVAEYGPAKK